MIAKFLQSANDYRRRLKERALGLLLIALALSSVEAQTVPPVRLPEASPESPSISSVLIDVKEGMYDANQLRRAFGYPTSSELDWREIKASDVVALTALKLAGDLEFELKDDALLLQLRAPMADTLVHQLAPCQLALPKDIKETDRIIVLVHGLEGSQNSFSSFEKRCAKAGIATANFDYPNDGPIISSANALGEQLIQLSGRHPNLKLAIVAHSMGGLVATWAITKPDFPDGLVTDVVTLGTPFKGTAIAEFQEEAELMSLWNSLTSIQFASLNTVYDGQGEAAADLTPGSQFFKQFAKRTISNTTKFHVVAGTKSFLSKSERDVLLRDLPSYLKNKNISPEYAKKLTRLINAAELEDGNSDGAVTLESATRFPNPTSSRKFATTHFGLLEAQNGVGADVFDWILQMLKWETAKKIHSRNRSLNKPPR
jgi:pimeloyl-ACP methyl ester carboxylesterase